MILDINISNKLKIKYLDEDLIFNWLQECAGLHEKKLSVLEIHLLTDDELLQLNRLIFNRDYLTDVISMAYPGTNDISGSIYISYERVEENAQKYSPSVEQELYRVIVHGLLHILGYDDITPDQKQQMRNLENQCLKLLP